MDWSNERYVRLYTRDTPEWLCLPWQARALWPGLLRKFDRAGVIATKLGARGIAVLVALPVEVVEVGLAALLDDGCLEVHELGYVAPNFLKAQETASSDAQRKRDSRERYRGVTKRDSGSQNVTKSHERSQAVTDGHSVPSRAVPDLAEPSRAEPSFGAALGFDFGDEAAHPATPDEPKKPKKATQLQPHWNPGPVVVPDGVDIGTELERFKDWARANGKRFVDWQAAWRNWVRKAGEYTQKRGTGQIRASGSAAEAFAAFARAGES